MRDLPDIPSPCMAICVLDEATGYCEGCMRTLDEISVWGRASNAERLEILQLLKERRRAAGRTSAADMRPRRRNR